MRSVIVRQCRLYKFLPLVVLGSILLLAAAACGGEDRPTIDVISEDGTGSGSGTGSGTGSVSGTGLGSETGSVSGTGVGSETGSVSGTGVGSETSSVSGTGVGSETGSGTGTGIGAEPGVVLPKPEGATQVDVQLLEWAVIPEVSTVQAGEIYFLADNVGPADVHELVIIRTNTPADQLDTIDGRVTEDQVNVIGEIEPFLAGTEASGVFTLTPGNYALICNIVEIEDDAVESHYLLGMRTGFTVE